MATTQAERQAQEMAQDTTLGPCGCDLLEGRCTAHAEMMRAIRAVYQSTAAGPSRKFAEVWSLSDGYGVPGYVPPQGFDWSGIRDSSIAAIEAMFVAAIRD